MGSRFSRGLATAAALALAPAASPSQGVSLAPRDTAAQRDSVVQVAMAISGGASLGSYQSGVTWALIEFYRHATLDTTYARTHGLKRRYSLASIAGASAGNINAVLSAIEWCSGKPPRPPEESLYWSVWVRVGIDQLLATAADLERSEDRGLFRRAFFREELYGEIERELASAGDMPCDVPIGITLTRVYPDSFAVQPRIRVPIQRFASIFRLTRDPARADCDSRRRTMPCAMRERSASSSRRWRRCPTRSRTTRCWRSWRHRRLFRWRSRRASSATTTPTPFVWAASVQRAPMVSAAPITEVSSSTAVCSTTSPCR